MKAILRTLCGCSREIDTDILNKEYPPKVISIPISNIMQLKEFTTDSVAKPSMKIREFELLYVGVGEKEEFSLIAEYREIPN